MAPQLSFPEEVLAVTTPRQLAPTVEQVMKGVEITGEAQRGIEELRHQPDLDQPKRSSRHRRFRLEAGSMICYKAARSSCGIKKLAIRQMSTRRCRYIYSTIRLWS